MTAGERQSVELTSFIGRERMLQRLVELLSPELPGRWRLLAMTGPGGSGKTCVALRLLELAGGRYREGACFVALAPIGDSRLVFPTIAQTVGVQQVQRKREDPNVWYLLGQLDNLLACARLPVESMQALCADYSFSPDVATANAVLIRKTLAASAVLAVAEKALEPVGGQGLCRALRLERLLRDVHAPSSTRCQPNASTA